VRRHIAGALAFVAISLAALSVSALVHLATPLGRRAARDGFVAFLSSRIRGTVEVGELTNLEFDRVDLTDFRAYAPNGEMVIRTERMGGHVRWGELFSRGTIEIAPSYFDRAEIWLRPHGPQGQVSLVYAMEVPDGVATIPLELNDIELVDNILHAELPGAPPVVMRNVDGLADLHIGHQFTWRLDENRGYADLEPIHAGFRHMSGRLTSDNARPLVVQMMVDVEAAEPGARLAYEVPALAGRDGQPHMSLQFPVDLGVSGARDDCSERDGAACQASLREELAHARERAERAPERERERDELSAREREAN
jgi:hypothetical protein